MHFEIRHQFDASKEQIAEALLDPKYLEFVLERHGVLLEVEPKKRDENEREVRRTVRYRPKPVIEKVGPKTVPPEWFAFMEESRFDKATKTLQFDNVPTSTSIQKMLVNKGTIRLNEIGPNRTERVVEGELKLVLPFLLKPLAMVAERLIHVEAVKLLDREAEVLTEWLSK
jgi:hypothetical protein